MRSIILLCSVFFFLLAIESSAQLQDGTYTFANDQVDVKLIISDGGWTISSATVVMNSAKKTLTGKGFYRKGGNFFWYEMEMDEGCSFEFDEPKNQMKLIMCCCTNGIKDGSYTLTRKTNSK